MATIQERRAYKEVLIILENLNLIGKIPENVISTLKSQQAANWNFVYNQELELDEQNILRETAMIFSNLYLAFICNDAEEKEELKETYAANQSLQGNTKVNNWGEILAKQNAKPSEKVIDEQKMVPMNNKSFVKKIVEFLKNIFR